MASLKKLRQCALGGRHLPDYEEDPLAWNAVWEEASLETTILMYSPVVMANRFGDPDESILALYRAAYHNLCITQYRLTVQVANHIANGFEEKWRAATVTSRRDHIVEAHIRMAVIGREDTRSSCGDLTVASLAEDNHGDGFLKLLRVYLHDDTSAVPTTPITFPYNCHSGTPLPDTTPKDVWRANAELERDLYICLFVLETLSSWENKPRPPPSLALKMPVKGELHPTLNKVFKDALGPSGLKEIKQEIRVGHGTALRSCESCGAIESVTKYMQCKVCADVLNRRTFYCSKKCQRDDWPSHKRVCGKTMTLETARNAAITSTKFAALKFRVEYPQIGPAVDGYKRSPALIAQVHRLNDNPEIDYYLATGSPGQFSPFSPVPMHSVRKALRAIRDRAVIKGDRSAAAALGEFLVVFGIRMAPGRPLPREAVMNQLALEYGEGIRQDMHILEVISWYHRYPDITQIQRYITGDEIYDVSVLPEAWSSLDSYFRLVAHLHNRSEDAPWSDILSS